MSNAQDIPVYGKNTPLPLKKRQSISVSEKTS